MASSTCRLEGVGFGSSRSWRAAKYLLLQFGGTWSAAEWTAASCSELSASVMLETLAHAHAHAHAHHLRALTTGACTVSVGGNAATILTWQHCTRYPCGDIWRSISESEALPRKCRQSNAAWCVQVWHGNLLRSIVIFSSPPFVVAMDWAGRGLPPCRGRTARFLRAPVQATRQAL